MTLWWYCRRNWRNGFRACRC